MRRHCGQRDDGHVTLGWQPAVDAAAKEGHLADGPVMRETHDPVGLRVEMLEHEPGDTSVMPDMQLLQRIA